MVRELTAEKDGFKVTVREAKGSDVWDRHVIQSRIRDAASENPYRAGKFADFVLQTVNVEGLGFTWPTLNSGAAEVDQAYQAWCDMSYALMVLWGNALVDVETPASDPATAPGADPKN